QLYTLSLHDALPILASRADVRRSGKVPPKKGSQGKNWRKDRPRAGPGGDEGGPATALGVDDGAGGSPQMRLLAVGGDAVARFGRRARRGQVGALGDGWGRRGTGLGPRRDVRQPGIVRGRQFPDRRGCYSESTTALHGIGSALNK